MKDETYVFISDVKNKGSVARSARHRKTHAGKGGRVRLPSDNLSKKELQKMNGECKSFRLNEPMKWQEFKAMPDDIKATYIKLIRQKFNPPGTMIAQMLGVTEATVRRELARLNLTEGQRSGRMKWDKEGFWAWVHGVDKLPTPVIEEVTEEPSQEEQIPVITSVEPEIYVEDDLSFEEPECVSTFVPVERCLEVDAENALLKAQIDGLQKANDELMAKHENDCNVIEKLRLLCSEKEDKMKILEAQMEVVRMIFGRN